MVLAYKMYWDPMRIGQDVSVMSVSMLSSSYVRLKSPSSVNS